MIRDQLREQAKVLPAAQNKLAELFPPPMTAVPIYPEVIYPESDGEPMAETDVHRDQMTDALIYPLKEYFRAAQQAGGQPVYVSGNILLYYVEGNPYRSVAPDVLVTFGIEQRQRRTYKVWVEGKAPDVVFELTSRSTRRKDTNEKRLLYERLGVREYFIFDPLREYLQPPLQGFRLVDDHYVPLQAERVDGDDWELHSEVLGLTLHTAGDTLRLYDPVQQRYLLMAAEEAQARRSAEQRTMDEAQARRTAETKLQAAEAELAHLRALLAGQDD